MTDTRSFIVRACPTVRYARSNPIAARRCRAQGVPWHATDHEYGAQASGGPRLVADDADVSVVAGHASRMAIDTLARPDASLFPHPAYVFGMSRAWIFTDPFDTCPIDFTPEGDWKMPGIEGASADALALVGSLLEKMSGESRTDTPGQATA